MAGIDARINLILNGTAELNKLESKLRSIEQTADSIQGLFEQGILGRVTDLNTYVRSLNEIGKAATATRAQASAVRDVNAELKKGILIESQLRRERSRTSRLSRAFQDETKGLDQTKGKLKEIKQQFDEVSSALKSAFKLGDIRVISQLRNELSALIEDQREWNRTLAGTKNIGVNSDLLKEQARNYAQEIQQLRKRALALQDNEEIVRRIAAAEYNLVKQRDKATGTFTAFADPRLGREILSGVKSQIAAEEQLARERAKNAASYAKQQEAARSEIFKTLKAAGGIAKKAGGATFDALTFGQGSRIARGTRNAAIRGGLGLGALGIGGAYATAQEALGSVDLGMLQGPAVTAAKAIGGALNGAFGGVPAIINDMLSALGSVPSSLGLASVAALAFAPAMKTAADAVFLAGKSFGQTKFGENIKLTLDRQTNLFESVINKATEMNMVLNASRSGLDAVGRKVQTIPALPAAGQTAFAGQMRRGRGGAFIGGGAREINNPEFLATAAGTMAQRTQEAADVSLLFAEGLGRAADEAKTIAEYLKEANQLRPAGETSTQRFIRKAIERGRLVNENKSSADLARFRSARALAEEAGTPMFGTPLALPAAGQTSFKGQIRQVGEAAGERGGIFLGGGAREAIKNAEFLTDISGRIAARTKDAAEQTYRYAQGLKQASAEAAGLASKSKKSGLEEAIESLREARSAKQDFLGGISPKDAIDKIVREFNTGKPAAGDAAQNISETFNANLRKGASRGAAAAKTFASAAAQAIKDVFGIASPSRFMIELVQNLITTYIAEMQKSYPRIRAATDKAFGQQTLLRDVNTLKATNKGFEIVGRPSTGFRPFQMGAGTQGATSEFQDMMSRFRREIAGLTTQPEIYQNLLNAIPDSAITTNLTGAANRRALASEIPSFMSAQRQLGPGELEKEIASAAAKYFRTVRTPDPWVGLVGDYREFIDKVIAATQKLNQSQLALPGSRIAGALPPVSQNLTAVQQQRIQEAYRRSEARGLSVLSQDAFRASGRPALSAANFGFMADPARISRLSGIGRALPPAIDVASSEVENQSRSLRQSVSDLFDRISSAVRSAFGGGIGFGGGGRGGAGGGAGDFGRRFEQAAAGGPRALLGLRELAQPATASIRELEALSAALKEFRAILDPTSEGFDRLERQLRETAANLDRQLERRAPDADFLTRRFGPRGAAAVSEGLIGGAFPLLFGQGVGAAVGGGLGGAAGGFAGGGLGFGLSLVGTALGTAFDTLSQAAQDTGRALKYPTESFDKLKEAGLFASRQQEYYISKLIESGRVTQAAAQIQSEIINKVGVQGYNDLVDLGDSASNLSKKWAELNYQMQALIAGPVGDFLNLVAKIVGAKIESNKTVGLGERIAGLTSDQRKAFTAEVAKLSGERAGISGAGLKAREDILNRIAPQQAKAPSSSLEEQEKVLLKSIETADKIRALNQQGIDVQRTAQDLRLSIEDTVYDLRKRATDLEREAVEFRRSVEDEIFNKRQGLERQLIENDRLRQQNAIDAFDLQLQKAGAGLDPIAQGIVDAAREYVKVRAEGEANLLQKERELKLQLQSIDRETAKYKLSVEDRVRQMVIQREEFSRDVGKVKFQLERSIGDYVIKVEEYRLAMARRRFDLAVEEGNIAKATEIARQEGLSTPATGKNYANVGGFQGGRQMLHGIPGFAGFDRSHATETNIHYHFAGKNPAETKAVADMLKGYGYQITEFGQYGQRVGRHSAGSQHYRSQGFNAFDIPGSSMGGPMSQIVAGQKKVHALIGDFLYGRSQQAKAGVPTATGASSAASTAAPTAPTAPSMPALPSAPQMVEVNDLLQTYIRLQNDLKSALASNNQLLIEKNSIELAGARFQLEQRALAPLRGYSEQNRQLQLEIDNRRVRNRLLMEGANPKIADAEVRVLQIQRDLDSVLTGINVSTNELVKQELKRLKLNPELVDAEFTLTEATLARLIATEQDVKKQEELRSALQKVLDLKNQLSTTATDEANTAAGTTRGIAAQESSFTQQLGQVFADKTEELSTPGIDAARSIVDTFTTGIQDSFKGITGLSTLRERFDLQYEVDQLEKLRSKTQEGTDEYKRYTDQINQAKLKLNEMSNVGVQVKNALSQMMAGIADAFAEMAAKIIAKQILMFVWGTALKALGIAASIGSAGATSLPGSMGQATNTGLDTGAGNITDMLGGLAAKGAYFNGGIASFGSGGMFTNSIVSSPTLFRFADGGIRKTGLMGEAGPEAIIPLSRGADGRLGVDATGFSDAISEARDALDEASDAMAQSDGVTGLELPGGASDGYGGMGLRPGETQGKMSRATAMAISDSRGAVEMIKRITQENDAKAAAAAASASPETRELYKLLATKDSNTIREITNNQVGGTDGADQLAAGSQQQLAYGDAISAARGVLASEISGGEPDQMQQMGEAGAITNSREFIEKITDRISSPDSSKKAEASAFGDSRNAVGKSSGSQSAISTKETISALMQARDSRETSSAISQTREVLSSVSSMNKEKNMERVMESNVTAITKPLDIKYESQMINNVEYVTVDQYQRGLAEAAERGRALTLSSLKNSVKARRQIGI